jgi:hypothetical protein
VVEEVQDMITLAAVVPEDIVLMFLVKLQVEVQVLKQHYY